MEVKVGDVVKVSESGRGVLGRGSWIDNGKVIRINGDQVWLKAKDGHDEDWFNLEHVKDGKVIVIGKYKPKNPTHLVVWEVEGCGDPCEFFTDEKAAKEKVKKLSDDGSVKKESIVLVEIKSVQKVNVIKNVRLSGYKI